MAFILRNTSTQQLTCNLLGGNAVTLMPQGSFDVHGKTDRAVIMKEEAGCVDVVSAVARGLAVLVETQSVRTSASPESATEPVTPEESTAPRSKKKKNS